MSSHHERVRYPLSVDPVATDGRDVDSEIAILSGEAAQQRATREDGRLRDLAPHPWERTPRLDARDATYYDVPLLKPSVWTLDIPIYYFLGGAAGAALTLGAAIQLVARSNGGELRRLSAICHWTGIVGSTAGAVFLIHDLGRPMRFLYMVRVFRPTSPMNIGAWILTGAAPTAIAAGLFLNRDGVLGRVGEVCGYLSGIFGAALATYTGVLVSTTAIPVWQQSRKWLPVLFAASAAASAGSIFEIVNAGESGRRIAHAFGTAGRVAEIAAAIQVERAASAVPKVGEAMRRGGPGFLWNAATALTVASLTLSLLAGRSRKKTVAAGLMGVAGSLCMRFAVHYIGDRSARDPRAAFAQQRSEST